MSLFDFFKSNSSESTSASQVMSASQKKSSEGPANKSVQSQATRSRETKVLNRSLNNTEEAKKPVTNNFNGKVFDPNAFEYGDIALNSNKSSEKKAEPLQPSRKDEMLAQDEKDFFTEAIIEFDASKLFVVDDDLLEYIDAQFAAEKMALPISLSEGVLTVACDNKANQRVIHNYISAQHKTLKIRFLKFNSEQLKPAIDHHYLRRDGTLNERQRQQHYQQISQKLNNDRRRDTTEKLVFSIKPDFTNKDTAIKELIENLLCDAHWQRATDIDFDHILDDTKQKDRELMVCRVRIDGDYQILQEEPMDVEKYKRIPHILKIYAGLDPNTIFNGQSGVIRPTLNYATRQSSVEFRCNFIPSADGRGESISIRLQEKDNFQYSLDNIGLLSDQNQLLRSDILSLTGGMVLICGPVNKGKNTTQVSVIKEIRDLYPQKKIVTLEDPTEFNLPYITQIAVDRTKTDEVDGKPVKRGFKYYLAQILRHNPDIIGIGEIREPESAQMAFEAAGIGHLFLSTLHTENALETISRLRNLGIEDYKIGTTLRSVIAQRLVKRNCLECERVDDKNHKNIPYLKEMLQKAGLNPSTNFVKATGYLKDGSQCKQCKGTGYFGRIGIFEILVVSEEAKELITKGADTSVIRRQVLSEGFKTLWINGLTRAVEGVTTLDQLVYHLGNPNAKLEGVKAIKLDPQSDDQSFESQSFESNGIN